LAKFLAFLITGGISLLLAAAGLTIADLRDGIGPVLVLLPAIVILALVSGAESTRQAWGRSLVACGLTALGLSAAGFLISAEQITWLNSRAAEPADQENADALFGGIGLGVAVICLGTAGFLLRRRRILRPAEFAALDDRSPLLAGFSDYYEREVAGPLARLEDRRKAVLRRKWVTLLVALPPWAVAALFGVDGFAPNDPPNWLAALWALALLVICLVAWLPKFNLQTDITNLLFERIPPFFGLTYRSSVADMGVAQFRAMGLVPKFHEATLTNVLEGRRHGVHMVMAEALLQKVSIRAKPIPRTVRRTVFQGVLLAYALPARVRGRTMILRDRGSLLNWLKDLKLPEQQVRLDDPTFEQCFEVFSSDPAEARAFCSGAFMQRAVALSDRLGKKARLQMGFIDDRLLISILPSERPFGPVALESEMADPSRAWEFAEEVALVLEVAGTLDLATRMPA
jgi:hypothetical protein